ncbi:MAG: glycosyltransferase [Kiritimatiellia bacterium]
MKVLQIVDSLDPGGTERMAVNFAGGLAKAGVESHLCVSRHCGPLASALPTTVSTIVLNRRWRFDWRAVARLRAYVVRRQITHIHAHSTSVALGWLIRFNRNCRLLWHVHTGAPKKSAAGRCGWGSHPIIFVALAKQLPTSSARDFRSTRGE